MDADGRRSEAIEEVQISKDQLCVPCPMNQIVLGNPITQNGRKKHGSVAIDVDEGGRHAGAYQIVGFDEAISVRQALA